MDNVTFHENTTKCKLLSAIQSSRSSVRDSISGRFLQILKISHPLSRPNSEPAWMIYVSNSNSHLFTNLYLTFNIYIPDTNLSLFTVPVHTCLSPDWTLYNFTSKRCATTPPRVTYCVLRFIRNVKLTRFKPKF